MDFLFFQSQCLRLLDFFFFFNFFFKRNWQKVRRRILFVMAFWKPSGQQQPVTLHFFFLPVEADIAIAVVTSNSCPPELYNTSPLSHSVLSPLFFFFTLTYSHPFFIPLIHSPIFKVAEEKENSPPRPHSFCFYPEGRWLSAFHLHSLTHSLTHIAHLSKFEQFHFCSFY